MKRTIICFAVLFLITIIILFLTGMITTNASTTTLADKVISLSLGNTWSRNDTSGVYQTNNHEYRYIGNNVNNYVSFNNDLYRIIGVFDSNSTGVSGNFVKLIRARSLGGYVWGVHNSSPEYTTYSDKSNNWEISNINILLNEFFLNATNTSSTYGQCSDWTYFSASANKRTENCSAIIKYGIQTSSLRNYIQPVTWYLKGYDSNSHNREDFYTCERSDATTITDCTSGNSGAYPTKVLNKSIGLMYVSDYLYASIYYSSSSSSNAVMMYYGASNWLYNGEEWTITPVGSQADSVFFIFDGYLYTYGIKSRVIRPTFYLKSQVYVTGGDGSFHNPYTIACDTCSS